MKNGLTNKAKLYVLIGLFFVFLLLSYQLNIKKTLQLRHELKILNTKLSGIEDVPFRLKSLQNELNNLDRLIGSSMSHNDLHEKLIALSLDKFKDHPVHVWELSDAYTYADGNMQFFTNKVLVEGHFNALLNFLYDLETREKLGRVNSASFFTRKIRESNEKKLFLEIYLQNIEIE